MVTASGVRIGWTDLPAHVRAAVERIVGGRVVEAVSQPGGFSPGTADRVRTADGRRAFVKAVSPAQNEFTPGMHRAEAKAVAAMPASAPVPALLGTFDDGEWIALVLRDIEGRHPVTPWEPGELRAVLAALDELAAALTPSPLPALAPASVVVGPLFGGWDRVAADPPCDLDPWAAERLGRLRALAARAVVAMDGETMVNQDVRADNLLIDRVGRIWVLDWPGASRGAAWLDSALLLINVLLYGGHDVDALWAERAATTGADPDDILAVLAGAAGYFADAARQPPPPGLPTLRAFQRAQMDPLMSWLQRHL